MKKSSMHILHRLREYALEQEELRLMKRQREEQDSLADCQRSLDVMQQSYSHGTGGMKIHEFARRDGCVREARVRHNLDLRQLGLAQMAVKEQIQNTLAAKTRADMIAKVIDRQQAALDLAADLKVRKEIDDIAQNQFTYRAKEARDQAHPEEVF